MADLENEVSAWVETVAGEQRGGLSFGDWLRDGQVLCRLANKIQPGICPRINTSTMPFKQMENVTAFIQACRKLGVLEKDVFSTVDLFEQKNLKSVCICIYNLGSLIRTSAPSFKGPYLGVAQTGGVTDVARKKQSVTQDMGFRQDIQDEVRAGVRKSRIAGEDPGAGGPPAAASGAGGAGEKPRPSQAAVPAPASPRPSQAASAAPASPAPPQTPPASKPATPATGGYPSRPSVAPDARSPPSAPSSPPGAAGLEAEVRGWLETVSGESGGAEKLGDWLHDGKVLCKVANTLQPGICPKVNSSDMPFKQMENITAFIHACRKLGVLEKDVFSTVDLYEQKNMKSFCQCVYNLASVVRTTAPSFKGPYLGVAQTAAVTDAARKKSVVTQDMGFRKDIDVEVRAGARKSRIAGDDPGAAGAEASAPAPQAASPARTAAPPAARVASPRAAPSAAAESQPPAEVGQRRQTVPASQHLAPPEAPGDRRSSSPMPRSPSPGWSRPRDDGPVKARLAGPLLKLSPHFMGGWQLRWFEIAGGRMRYWAQPSDVHEGKAPKGEVELLGLKVQNQGGMKFDVTTTASGSRTFSLDADAHDKAAGAGWDLGPKPALTQQDWVKALEQEAVLARRA